MMIYALPVLTYFLFLFLHEQSILAVIAVMFGVTRGTRAWWD
jgi:hypothetical protein